MASIDIHDVDVRTLVFSAVGVDGSAVYSVAIVPQGQPFLDENYVIVDQTADSSTTVDIPFGTTFNQVSMGGVGRYAVSGKVIDGSNVVTLTSEYTIDFTDRSQP